MLPEMQKYLKTSNADELNGSRQLNEAEWSWMLHVINGAAFVVSGNRYVLIVWWQFWRDRFFLMSFNDCWRACIINTGRDGGTNMWNKWFHNKTFAMCGMEGSRYSSISIVYSSMFETGSETPTVFCFSSLFFPPLGSSISNLLYAAFC